MVNDTDQFTITQAAKILDIHRNTLCRHTDEGMIKCGYRKHSGRKFYTGKEIKRYWRIA